MGSGRGLDARHERPVEPRGREREPRALERARHQRRPCGPCGAPHARRGGGAARWGGAWRTGRGARSNEGDVGGLPRHELRTKGAARSQLQGARSGVAWRGGRLR